MNARQIFLQRTEKFIVSVIYEVEADIGQMAFAFTEDEGVLCVHPRLEDRSP